MENISKTQRTGNKDFNTNLKIHSKSKNKFYFYKLEEALKLDAGLDKFKKYIVNFWL